MGAYYNMSTHFLVTLKCGSLLEQGAYYNMGAYSLTYGTLKNKIKNKYLYKFNV